MKKFIESIKNLTLKEKNLLNVVLTYVLVNDDYIIIDNKYFCTMFKNLNYFAITEVDIDEQKIINLCFTQNLEDDIKDYCVKDSLKEIANFFLKNIDCTGIETTFKEIHEIMQYKNIKNYIETEEI